MDKISTKIWPLLTFLHIRTKEWEIINDTVMSTLLLWWVQIHSIPKELGLHVSQEKMIEDQKKKYQLSLENSNRWFNNLIIIKYNNLISQMI